MTSISEKRKCPRTLSSAEAPLCRREVGGERKESAQGTMGGRFFSSSHRQSRAYFYQNFLSVSQRKTAKERSLHTILGFPLRNITAGDLRKNDVTKYKRDSCHGRRFQHSSAFALKILPDLFFSTKSWLWDVPSCCYSWYLNPFCNPIVHWCGVSRRRAAVIGCK